MHQREFLLLFLASSTTAGGTLRRRRRNKADGTSYAQTTNTNDAQIYDNESPINDGSTRRHLYESNKPSSDANVNTVLINKHARVLTTDYGDDIIITTLDDDLLDDDISTALSPTEAPTYTVVWALDDDDIYKTTPDPTYAPVTPTESPTYDNLDVGTVDDSPPTDAPTYTVVTSLDDDDDMLDDDDLSTYYSPTEAPTYIAVGSLDDDVTTLDDDDVSTASTPTPTQSPSYVPTSYHPTYYPTYSPT